MHRHVQEGWNGCVCLKEPQSLFCSLFAGHNAYVIYVPSWSWSGRRKFLLKKQQWGNVMWRLGLFFSSRGMYGKQNCDLWLDKATTHHEITSISAVIRHSLSIDRCKASYGNKMSSSTTECQNHQGIFFLSLLRPWVNLYQGPCPLLPSYASCKG